MRAPWIVALLTVALASGCAGTPPWRNRMLDGSESIAYVGRDQMLDPARSRDLLVVISFSGGGSRAAALAHETLAELDRYRFIGSQGSTSLAREIDMVNGVSGGSVAAAHVAMHGVEVHLRRFGRDFLEVDFQTILLRSALSPDQLLRMGSPRYGRGHLLQQELDALLFHGATFSDLAARPQRPYLIIGATHLGSGAEFDFASDQFGLICSSLDDVPLAFAVAASSSVPLVFSPLTLQNFAADCPHPPVAGHADSPAMVTARQRLIRDESEALASGEQRFLHLVDGGVSDNLGLRRIADYVVEAGGVRAVLEALHAPGPLPRRIVFISVDAERRGPLPIDSRGEVPNVLEVLRALIDGGLARYSRETSLVFGAELQRWQADLQQGSPDDPQFFLIEVGIEQVADAGLRDRLRDIPTAFRLDPEDLALLRRAARISLDESSEFARFLDSMPR